MALATRELELVIMAKDKASATLARVSGALALIGGATVRAGLEGAEFFVDATKEAMEFNRQIALTMTQVELAGVTFEDVSRMVTDALWNTAVPLEQLQELAYDLFSTVTFDNMEQAEGWLRSISDAAVAGQAPVRDVGRAVIAWINAMDVAPTVDNVNRILDIQFELVRKGAGDFGEFASVVGRAIPAFTAAKQGPEELAGALAFLTRNGLSTAMSATSAARAVELLYSPKTIKNLQKLGIEVQDQNGNFRKMDDLLRDVVKQFDGLTDAEKKAKFADIFGTGSIQARRFFDVLLGEGNFEEYLFLLDEVRNSAGEVGKALEIMTDEPAVQLEVLTNRWRAIRKEIGDRFLPLVAKHLFPALFRLTDWWKNLDDAIKDNIIKWSAIATAIVILGGAFMVVLGSLGLFLGLLYAFLGTWTAVAVVLGGGFLLFAGLVGGIIYAIQNWDELKARFDNFSFEDLKDKFIGIGDTIKSTFANPDITTGLDSWIGWLERIAVLAQIVKDAMAGDATANVGLFSPDWVKGIANGIETIRDVFTDPDITTAGDKWIGLLERIAVGWELVSDAFGEGDTLVDKIKGVFIVLPDAVFPIIESLFQNISRAFFDWVEGGGIERILQAFTAARVRFIEIGGKVLLGIVEGIGQALPMVAEALSTALPPLIEALLGAVVQLIPILVQAIIPLIQGVVDTIITLLPTIIQQIVTILITLVPVLLDAAVQLFTALVNALPIILPVLVQGILDLIMAVIQLLPTLNAALTEAGAALFVALLQALESILPLIIVWILGTFIPGLIKTIGENVGKFFEVGGKLFIALAEGIIAVIGTVLGSVGAIVTGIIKAFTSLPGTLWDIGKNIVTGLGNGISSAAGWVKDKVTGLGNKISGWFKGVFGIRSPSKLFAEHGVDIIRGLEKGWSSEMKSFNRMVNRSFDSLERQQARFGFDLGGGLGISGPGARTTIGTSIGSQIVIERVESQADPSEIARALAWEALNS